MFEYPRGYQTMTIISSYPLNIEPSTQKKKKKKKKKISPNQFLRYVKEQIILPSHLIIDLVIEKISHLITKTYFVGVLMKLATILHYQLPQLCFLKSRLIIIIGFSTLSIYLYIYIHEHTHTHIIAIWTNKEIPLGYETRLTKSQNTPMNNLFCDVKS